MTRNEFIERTNVTVTPDEYEHIDAVYMASDLDKDEFCAAWKQMNRSRVKTYAERRRFQMKLDKVFTMMMTDAKWQTVENAFVIAASILNDREIAALNNIGITMTAVNEWGMPYCKDMTDIKHEFLKLIEK